jgi:hypothetical protein
MYLLVFIMIYLNSLINTNKYYKVMDERKLIFIMTYLCLSIILVKSSPFNFLTTYKLLFLKKKKTTTYKPNRMG